MSCFTDIENKPDDWLVLDPLTVQKPIPKTGCDTNLVVQNYLSEFKTDAQKQKVKDNLGLYVDNILSKNSTNPISNKSVYEEFNKLKSHVKLNTIDWLDDSDMNNYVEEGTYNIKGKKTRQDDNLPIANIGDINAQLTVITTENDNNIVITQVLNLNNNVGGEGNVYIRSCQNGEWKAWSKLQTNMEVGQVNTLDHLTDNGIYSGVFTDGTPTSVGTFYDTFVLIVINNYAVSIPTGNPQSISQLKYSLGLDGSITVASRKRDQHGYWDNWESLDEKSLVEEEKSRAELAEKNIKDKAVDADSLNFQTRANEVALDYKTIEGVGDEITIPAATTEQAGVMSADILNSISVNAPLIENIVILNSGKQSTNANYDATDYITIPNGVIDLSASGWLAGGALLVAFYDATKTFISGYGNFGDATSTFYSITHYAIPENARYVRYSSNRVKDKTILVWGNMEYNEGLGVLPIVTQTIPAQFYRKQSGDSLRVLCFGSSWLTNTWWYLNKMTNAAGINATIKCYFSSSCPFSKWVDRYEGKEETGTSTDFRRFDSVNGSDWSVEYVIDVTEFRRSLEEDWDVIVFQQGSSDSTNWNSDNGYANHYQKLMSYIKRSAKPWTVICYNNTWTPKLGAGSTQTKEAQQKWQELNNENCIKFTNAVGLSNFVIPCGAAIWALRNDSVIADADDFMEDDLHIKNGLPIYLTGLTLFRAVVTPFYGIDIDDIAWLPDESTQKNLSSGSSWMSIDSEQATRVKDMVKLAFSNRYGFYTL